MKQSSSNIGQWIYVVRSVLDVIRADFATIYFRSKTSLAKSHSINYRETLSKKLDNF
ncbi:hypothetical protein ALC53_13535 [Atta colombica]|uniref:Uncharacterized protein n=1 Tax=Atta colombica TaxID=520822 RepID=A0A195AVJ6_9HYME|nr:hypothetical protein ALC53_13535 [Atta colombica]